MFPSSNLQKRNHDPESKVHTQQNFNAITFLKMQNMRQLLNLLCTPVFEYAMSEFI